MAPPRDVTAALPQKTRTLSTNGPKKDDTKREEMREGEQKEKTGEIKKGEGQSVEHEVGVGRGNEEGIIEVTVSTEFQIHVHVLVREHYFNFLFQLTRQPGTSLGIELEGGIDTSLQYLYIKSFQPGSESEKSGHLKRGDQLISCGEKMLIGVSSVEAWSILNEAPLTVKIVAARKNESLVRLRNTERQKSSASEALNQLGGGGGGGGGGMSRPVSIHNRRFSLSLHFSPSDTTTPSAAVSTENINFEPIGEATPSPKATVFRPMTMEFQEQEFQVTLTREEGQKLGFGVQGGSDIPDLKHPHVSYIEKTCTSYIHLCIKK